MESYRTFVLPALFLLSLLAQSRGCGILTHITLGQRATEFFEVNSKGVDYRDLILRHQDAFQAGNPFPDTFYNGLCRKGSYHDVSEDTHWTPMANATVNYIRRKYPQPWSKDAQKVVAFLFGMVAHSTSDASWHSLGIDQGFLQAMGQVNFHGSYNKAHSTGDFGGDVVNTVELDLGDVGFLTNWYIPTADLVEIYRDLYGWGRMDADTITECALWMYLGRAGETLGVINLLYPYYSEKSPFLADRMQDYFLGAMDDMAAWTTNAWRNIVTMLDYGTQVCDLQKNPLYVKCDPSGGAPPQGQTVGGGVLRLPRVGTNHPDYISKQAEGLDPSFVTVEQSDRGVYLKPTHKLRKRFLEKLSHYDAAKRLDMAHTAETSPQAAEVRGSNTFYDTTSRYARLGRSMTSADVNNDGHVDLVIGAPGHSHVGNQIQGRVYVILGTESGLPAKNLTLDEDADLIFDGPQFNGQFGHALAVVDLNADGVNDLAVSAPTVGAKDLRYQGEVYVYLGQQTGGLSTKPDMTFTCSQRYCNLGWSLGSADVNKDGFADLVMGAPFAPAGGQQRGFAAAVFSKKTFKQGAVVFEDSFDWVRQGTINYSWFGYDVSASGTNVAVGAPAYRLCLYADCSHNPEDIQAAGKVYVYKTPLVSSVPEWHVFMGQKQNDYLGASVNIGSFGQKDEMIAVSLPTVDVGWLTSKTFQAGVTRMFDLDKKGAPQQVEFRGKRGFARFGSHTWFEDVNSDGYVDILIGAPHWTDGFWFSSGALQGRVFVFSGKYASGKVKEPIMELLYAEDKAKFGTSFTSVKTTKRVDLAVSAPSSNAGAKMGGRVVIFPLDA